MRKFTQIYNLISESEISEAYPVVSDNFPNVTFSDKVVGSSTPSKDRVNPNLLQDIEMAAAMANVKVDITTIVSGHRKGTRHEKGQAVDIARFYNDKGNPVGYSGIKSAKKRGIYDKIMAFVSALESLGYKKNVGESGNPKVVLTFGFENHHHHVHVSNTTGVPSEKITTPKPITKSSDISGEEDLPVPDEDDSVNIIPDTSTEKKGLDLFGGKLNPLISAFGKAFSQFGGMKPIVGGATTAAAIDGIMSDTEQDNFENYKETKSYPKSTNNQSSSEISKLPKNIQNSISQLKNSYGITITDEHIKKEFEQEGGYREDSGGVNSEASSQINKLIRDAKNKFPKLKNTKGIISDYRSYSDQVKNFGSKAKSRGIDDTQRANTIPGFSQHHTGKAFDIFSVETSWWNKNTDVKDWVAKNAPKYGFDVTYKKQGPLRIAEPWHLYYVGGEVNEQNFIKNKIIKEEIDRIKKLMK
jgi:LAS superfamily LD-carboxypeptidase LdcB